MDVFSPDNLVRDRLLTDWDRVLRFWPLLLPLVILIPAMAAFPYPSPESAYSDLVLTHYPYTEYIRQVLLKDFRLPLWYPQILSGHPLAANPLSGMFYPPGWIAWLLPLPLGFNVTIALHLLWGGIGMYGLARLEGRSRYASIFSAMAFVALPKLYAHYGAGHLTLLYAVIWTPWLLKVYRQGVTQERFSWWPSIVMALIFLADPRWTLYAVGLWWLYAIFQTKLSYAQGTKRASSRLIHLLAQSLLAVVLAAPLALPLLEFSLHSSRAAMSVEDVFNYSLPPARLLGLVYPDFGGFQEWMLYPGAVILLLCVLAIPWRKSLSGATFWLWSIIISLLLALGNYLPGLSFMAKLPLFDLLRVPSRILFVTGLSMTMLAAYPLEVLLEESFHKRGRSAGLFLMAITTFVIALSLSIWLITDELLPNYAWGGIAVLISAVWLGLRLNQRISWSPWYLVLILLCLIDWGTVGHSLFSPRNIDDVFSEGAELAEYFSQRSEYGRIYSPSYSLPQQTAANHNLQLADGVDPLQLQTYVDFMQYASGVPASGYSVTMPPFDGGDPQVDNAAYLPDPGRLGWLNVAYIASEFDLTVDGLTYVDQIVDTRLYANDHVLPRAWLQPPGTTLGMDIQAVDIISLRPELIEISAMGPGQLVLSELNYPGWRVSVDSVTAEILTPADLLRGVQLGPGNHSVIFRFIPISLYVGIGLWIVGCIVLLISVYMDRSYKIEN